MKLNFKVILQKYKRELIGQFGIGKFVSLAVGSVFEVTTQCGGFAARIIFDKNEWEKDADKWALPDAFTG